MIYTRNATCAPVRAEEGITGILTPPQTATSFRDLPEDQQIGGYPTPEQLAQSEYDAATLDAEGRCVILEFPAFVLIGTYCPAQRDETRSQYRESFLRVLDARIRNLAQMGKRVVWTGDLNISREEIDTAGEWTLTPARQIFNELVTGTEDTPPILWDLCRGCHPDRRGMYTCWETKVNARPGNFGARIDYVVCSHGMKEWFGEADIQQGLMGSDHCPVYAELKDTVMADGTERHLRDLLNPPGMVERGVHQQAWSSKCLLPMSGKLIPEFDKRQSIRDMFTRKPSVRKDDPPPAVLNDGRMQDTAQAGPVQNGATVKDEVGRKRTLTTTETRPSPKKSKTQQSLTGFFATNSIPREALALPAVVPTIPIPTPTPTTTAEAEDEDEPDAASFVIKQQEQSQSWGTLFSKPVSPKCEHGEPCKTMTTRKAGANCGRSFWMCNRPLGPSGKQERGTAWRCNTFIWTSDWDTRGER